MVEPFVSRPDIRSALGSLIHGARQTGADGLHRLVLVDLAVAAPDMPDSDAGRDYAVRELLVTEITAALNQQRAVFGLPAVERDCRLDNARREIAAAVRVNARELIVWCALYYRYVRSDLDFRVDHLAALLTVHLRTMPRLHDDGLDLLTQRLIDSERRARQAQAERHLLAALPYSVPVRLFGRIDLLQASDAMLPTLSPCHLLVTGATGIGKTTFVQELLRRQITGGRLDHLIWLDEPASVQAARERTTEVLLRDPGQLSLRDALLIYRVALVIDGIDRLAAERAEFAALLRDLGAALVILINRTAAAREAVAAHIALPELDLDAAEALVGDALRLSEPQEAAAAARGLYAHVGGNPLALRLGAALWEQGSDWSDLETEVQERLLEQLFSALPEPVKRAWCALALAPDQSASGSLPDALHVDERALDILVRHGLVARSEGGSVLIGGARSFVRRHGEASAVARQVFVALEFDERALGIVELALSAGFPALSADERAAYIRDFWKPGLRRSHWALWREILESVIQQTEYSLLRTAYGTCLCRLGDWAGAEQVFYAVVADCGRAGLFEDQARALAEWAILARFQGNYERAQGFIAQARRFAERARDDDLLRGLTLQEAQIYVDQGKGVEASARLVWMPETPSVLVLSSQAQFALGNFAACRTLAERARRISPDDLATQASLYSLIGRSYQAEESLGQARAAMLDAISLLERLNDLFSLARAQSNLAGVLIPLKQLDDARRLLASAEAVQTRLGDQVGLSATRHNQTILGSYFAR